MPLGVLVLTHDAVAVELHLLIRVACEVTATEVHCHWLWHGNEILMIERCLPKTLVGCHAQYSVLVEWNHLGNTCTRVQTTRVIDEFAHGVVAEIDTRTVVACNIAAVVLITDQYYLMYSHTREVGKVKCRPAVTSVKTLAHGTVTVIAYNKHVVLVIGVDHNACEMQVVIGDGERLVADYEAHTAIIRAPQIPCAHHIKAVGVRARELIAVEILALAVKDFLERCTLII